MCLEILFSLGVAVASVQESDCQCCLRVQGTSSFCSAVIAEKTAARVH